METIYLDHNIYIYALSNPSIMETITSYKKKVKFVYSPAHIEEVHKALKEKGDSYAPTAKEIFELISIATNNLELLPSNVTIVFQRERPEKCYERVFGNDTTDRVKADSNARFQKDTNSYDALLATDKHYQSLSTIAPDKIWNVSIIKDALTELNQNMPTIVRKQNCSLDTLYCALIGADKTLPLNLQIEPNSFQKFKQSHTQLEFVIELLFRILSLSGYNTDKSESKAISGTHDVSHAIYATETAKFFTTDKRFAQRCKAVYQFLGVPTQVIVCKPDQISRTLQSSL